MSMSKKSKDKDSQDDPWTFRPYDMVEEWWKEFNRDGYWKKNQALNLALAKFMGKGDVEIQRVHDKMRGRKNES